MTLMDVSEIARLLADRVDDLVAALLPSAVREGHEWRVGGLDGSRGKSLCIHRSGPRAGVWKDFSSHADAGDALDLVAAVLFGKDKGKAVAWAKSWLGLDGMDPKRLKQVRAKATAARNAAQAQMDRDKKKRLEIARGIWHGGRADLIGTPTDRYLFGRGIDLRSLPAMPGAIRCHEALDYPAGMNDGRKEQYPAMVSMIVRGQQQIATHRTFLKDYGGGLVKKAPVRDAKLTIGSYCGGVIPIHRGASGKPLKDAPDGDKLIICEGIEDALTLMLSVPEYRIMAAISVGNMRNIDWLPPSIREISIAADNDPAEIVDERTGEVRPHPAWVAVHGAREFFLDQGREVALVCPPEGFKDFNEFHQHEMRKAREAARG